MTERYVSEGCEDLVNRHDNVATVTHGAGYHYTGNLRVQLTCTGNGFIAYFPSYSSTQQDNYLCMDYSEARDLVLALSTFKRELGFK